MVEFDPIFFDGVLEFGAAYYPRFSPYFGEAGCVVELEFQGDDGVASETGVDGFSVVVLFGEGVGFVVPSELPIILVALVEDCLFTDVTVIDGEIEHEGAIAVEASTARSVECLDEMLAGGVCDTWGGMPVELVAHDGVGFGLVEFAMKLQIEAVQDVAASCRVGKDDFVVGVLCVGLPGLVPIERRTTVVGIANARLLGRRFLVGTNFQGKFFNLQASVVVDGVEIDDGVVIVFNTVEIVGL